MPYKNNAVLVYPKISQTCASYVQYMLDTKTLKSLRMAQESSGNKKVPYTHHAMTSALLMLHLLCALVMALLGGCFQLTL